MVVLGHVFIGVFAIWVLATLVRHLDQGYLPARVNYWLDSSLVGFIVPRWNFFAPNPGIWDFHLLYRDRAASGITGHWHEMPIRSPRSFRTVLWNPSRFANKALIDIGSSVGIALDITGNAEGLDRRPQLLTISMPYLALLTYVSAAPGRYGAASTQFLVLMSSIHDTKVLLVSRYHQIA
jgi:hypothetical protein